MRKVISVILVFGAGVAVGPFFDGATRAEALGPQGGGAAVCVAQNGDVNGSGSTDLSECSGPGGNGLPDTGQTKCDTATGARTWCEGIGYCPRLELAGHSDWRLPNIRELESLIDYGRTAPADTPFLRLDLEEHRLICSSSSGDSVPGILWRWDSR